MQSDSFSPGFKYNRILQIYTKLLNGEIVNKSDEAARFKVDERSVQRDIDDLRAYFRDRAAEGEQEKEIVYSRSLNGYYLKASDDDMLTNGEVLAVCKILLESRAFCKDDISPMLEKIIEHCVPKSKMRTIKELISNELFHYVEPHHGKHFIPYDKACRDNVFRVLFLSHGVYRGDRQGKGVHEQGRYFPDNIQSRQDKKL